MTCVAYRAFRIALAVAGTVVAGTVVAGRINRYKGLDVFIPGNLFLSIGGINNQPAFHAHVFTGGSGSHVNREIRDPKTQEHLFFFR